MYIYYIYFNISCLYLFVSFCFSRATRKHFLLVGYLINMFKLNIFIYTDYSWGRCTSYIWVIRKANCVNAHWSHRPDQLPYFFWRRSYLLVWVSLVFPHLCRLVIPELIISLLVFIISKFLVIQAVIFLYLLGHGFLFCSSEVCFLGSGKGDWTGISIGWLTTLEGDSGHDNFYLSDSWHCTGAKSRLIPSGRSRHCLYTLCKWSERVANVLTPGQPG